MPDCSIETSGSFILANDAGECGLPFGETNYLNDSVGTWTVTTTPSEVPESSTFILLATGALGSVALARRNIISQT